MKLRAWIFCAVWFGLINLFYASFIFLNSSMHHTGLWLYIYLPTISGCLAGALLAKLFNVRLVKLLTFKRAILSSVLTVFVSFLIYSVVWTLTLHISDMGDKLIIPLLIRTFINTVPIGFVAFVPSVITLGILSGVLIKIGVDIKCIKFVD